MKIPPPSELTPFERIIFFDHPLLEWGLRIILTLNIVLPAVPYESHSYPMDVLALAAIGYWLSIARLKLFALFPHGYALFFTYLHLTGEYGPYH